MVWNVIPLVLVAVEKAVSMAHASHDYELMISNKAEADGVEESDGDSMYALASVGDVCLV